jgi:hypothetical protein
MTYDIGNPDPDGQAQKYGGVKLVKSLNIKKTMTYDVESIIKIVIVFVFMFSFFFHRLIDYLNDQLQLWEKSLQEIPDIFTNRITKNRSEQLYTLYVLRHSNNEEISNFTQYKKFQLKTFVNYFPYTR